MEQSQEMKPMEKFNWEFDWLGVANRICDAWGIGMRRLTAEETPLPVAAWPPTDKKREYVGLSSAGGCGRATALEVMGVPRTELDVSTIMAFADGLLLESHTNHIFELGGFPFFNGQEEVVVYKQEDHPSVLGHIDGLVVMARDEDDCWQTDDGWVGLDSDEFAVGLFEHKTLRAYPYQKLLGGRSKDNVHLHRPDCGAYILAPGTVKEVNPHNYEQIQGYLFAMQSHWPGVEEETPRMYADVPFALYFGRAREDNSVAIEIIQYDADAGQEAVEKCIAVAQRAGDKTVPERGYDRGDWHCNAKYCRYKEVCDKLDDGPVPLLEVE